MEEHVKRLVVERDELSDKLKKLSEFMKSDTFKKLDEDDKMILKIQKDSHMHACGDMTQYVCYRACGRVSLPPHVLALALSMIYRPGPPGDNYVYTSIHNCSTRY